MPTADSTLTRKPLVNKRVQMINNVAHGREISVEGPDSDVDSLESDVEVHPLTHVLGTGLHLLRSHHHSCRQQQHNQLPHYNTPQIPGNSVLKGVLLGYIVVERDTKGYIRGYSVLKKGVILGDIVF